MTAFALDDPDFWKPRRCMREPIDEIFQAATLLDRAVEAHLEQKYSDAAEFIRLADIPAIRAWTDSLWGSGKSNPDQEKYHRYRDVPNSPPMIPKAKRIHRRMPSTAAQVEIIARDGRHCIFCGIPVIHSKIRIFLKSQYPNALSWGRQNPTQHAAFQCMWMQFDHIIPHTRGGSSNSDNVVITCAGCNFGRMENTLDEFGLIDPRVSTLKNSTWDGLERVLRHRRPK
jgi:hypothetical protein